MSVGKGVAVMNKPLQESLIGRLFDAFFSTRRDKKFEDAFEKAAEALTDGDFTRAHEFLEKIGY